MNGYMVKRDSGRRLLSVMIGSLGLVLGWLVLLSIGEPVLASSHLIYVDADATGTADGTSWTDAYTNVQDALVPATSGDEIWVAEGVYYPDEGNGQTDNDRDSTFQLKNGVELYGGFVGAVTETMRSDRDWERNVTVLSGDMAQDDTTDSNGVVLTITHIISDNISDNNVYTVVTAGSGVSAVLDGFTITAGQANGFSSSSSPRGGGIFASSSHLTITHVIFRGNNGINGGAMELSGGRAIFTAVTFQENATAYVGGQGGAIFIASSSVVFDDVFFYKNASQAGSGGAVEVSNSTLSMTHVTFQENYSRGSGGAVRSQTDGNFYFNNVTFAGNQGNTGGAVSSSGDNIVFDHVTFSGNSAHRSWGGGIRW